MKSFNFALRVFNKQGDRWYGEIAGRHLWGPCSVDHFPLSNTLSLKSSPLYILHNSNLVLALLSLVKGNPVSGFKWRKYLENALEGLYPYCTKLYRGA